MSVAKSATIGSSLAGNKLKPGMVWTLVGLAWRCLAILTIVLFVTTQLRSGKSETAGKTGEAKNRAEDKPVEESQDANANEGSNNPPTLQRRSKRRKVHPTIPRNGDGSWIDASKKPATVGVVASVQVAAVDLGRPNTTPGQKTTKEYLLVRLKITNVSETKKLDYVSWNTPRSGIELRDDFDNTYKLITGQSFLGQNAGEPVLPGQSADELLVFQTPGPLLKKTKTLHLLLPTTSFKEEADSV